jgi:hypothetical protein
MEKFSPSLWFRCALAALLLSSFSLAASAQSARFDLTGPKIDARVTRDGKTLPIAYVPNLQPGDKLWLHPDLPPTQSVHLLLIVAFLRGTTNPPPDEWFTKIETWNRKTNEGITVTVPDEAQQAILFLAPETGGDFATLKKAVRGQPGIFVRASQDLLEAGFEQARIEKYIASMHQAPASDPKALLDHSNLLARTLNLKPNDDCFKRPVDMQYNCLTQSGNQTLLDDGHAQSVISVLSNGSSSDFITAASYTGVAGGGTYSAYVGAVVDLFRILGNLHTAQFQYIPAISFPEEESLNLRLNAAPSFRNPKSVIVIGLPSIQKSVPPPLRATDPKSIACLLKPKVVLPIEGAPLVFSTSFAHNLVLHLNVSQSAGEQPTSADIPLIPDAYQGGLIVDHAPGHRALPMPTEAELADPATHPAQADPKASTGQPATPSPSGEITGTITGSWGFDTFTGPTLHLQDILGANWKLAADDPLIAGRENHILLSSTGTACIASITAEATPGTFAPAVWKPANLPDLIDVNLPLKSHDPGALHISIQQFGENTPATVTARTFSEPATLTALEFHAGDTSITATGTNLSQVRQLTVDNLTFTPAPAPVPTATNQPTSNPANRETTLRVTLPDSTPAPKFKAGEKLNATVTLDDGRNITLPVTVAVSRPNLTLLSRNMGHPADPTLQLGSDEDLPISQQLTFSLKSPAPFPRNAKIEIANTDETLRTELTVAAGTLVLQNPHTILGTLDPLKTFGTSAFGPLRLRAVSPEGIPGDWIPLTTLVRLPTLDGITCPADPSALCTLSGANLYLLEAISTNPGFTTPITIPDGFVASTISIPRPTDLPATRTKSRTTTTTTTLYLRLRDDPTTTNSAIVQILPLPAKESPIPAPASITPPSVQPNAATSPSPTPTTAAPQTTPIQPAPTSAAP